MMLIADSGNIDSAIDLSPLKRRDRDIPHFPDYQVEMHQTFAHLCETPSKFALILAITFAESDSTRITRVPTFALSTC